MAVTIFNELRYYLKKMNLDNEFPVLIGKFRVPDSVVHFLVMLSMNIAVIFLFRFCFQSGFDLAQASSAFGVALGVSQLALIFVTLADNKDVIHETMELAQEIVSERMCI